MVSANQEGKGLCANFLVACNADAPGPRRFRNCAPHQAANMRPLRRFLVSAVFLVSSRGDDNRIAFTPAVIELVRVVDPRGGKCCPRDGSGACSFRDPYRPFGHEPV